VADGDIGPSAGTFDVTRKLKDAVKQNALAVMANNDSFGDPADGDTKTLRVEYTIDGAAGVRSATENEPLTITAAPGKTLAIQRAIYGDLEDQPDKAADGDVDPAAGAVSVDVTRKLKTAVLNNSLTVMANDDNFGHPAEWATKTLRVVYTIDGAPGVRSAVENDSLSITAAPGRRLVIQKATYGQMEDQPDGRAAGDVGPPSGSFDVTRKLKAAVRANSLTVIANDDTFGHPSPGPNNALRVQYTIDGAPGVRTAVTNEALTITAAPGRRLAIVQAVYGQLEDQPDQAAPGDIGPPAGSFDVTRTLRTAVRNNSLTIAANNGSLGGDPDFLVGKRLTVDYRVGGKPHTASADEGDTLTIPVAADGPGALVIVKALWGAPR
jgi:hypothetical protein